MSLLVSSVWLFDFFVSYSSTLPFERSKHRHYNRELTTLLTYYRQVLLTFASFPRNSLVTRTVAAPWRSFAPWLVGLFASGEFVDGGAIAP